MMYNPFSTWRISGSWSDHASYSAGGTDYPLGNRTPLPAPAPGTLRTSGGTGEWRAGPVGTAGLRSILALDTPVARRVAAESSPPEGGGDLVAVVFQHQSEMGAARHYSSGEILGLSGNTNGTTAGGDYHLHIHGLNAAGQRLDFTKFVRSRTTNVSDYNGDGFADVLGVSSAGELFVYPNTGRRTLDAPWRIGSGWGTFLHVMAADFTGNGLADVLGVDRSGNLVLYPNVGLSLGGPRVIGTGWGGFRHVMAADFSGDGHADVLGVDAVGNLLYYPNNRLNLSPPIRIGTGWGGFRHVMAADFSGDGNADVLGVDDAGNLLYYPNNGLRLSYGFRIGTGWGGFRHVMAADFSGDGHADVLGVDAAGDLLYYPNNGLALSYGDRVGTGWGGFLHVM